MIYHYRKENLFPNQESFAIAPVDQLNPKTGRLHPIMAHAWVLHTDECNEAIAKKIVSALNQYDNPHEQKA